MTIGVVAPYHLRCTECHGEDIITDEAAGDVVCRGCGVVLQQSMMSDTPEWRVFLDDSGGKDPSRVGGPLDNLLSDGGLGTFTVGGRDKALRSALRKGSAISNAKSANETALIACFERVKDIAHDLRLHDSVAKDAIRLLKIADDENIFKRKAGASGDAMCGAALYLVCKQQGASRTFHEMSHAAGVPQGDITKRLRLLQKNDKLSEFAGGVVRPEHLVPRFCSLLDFQQWVSAAALHVAQKAGELHLNSGQQPQAMAAAALLLSAGAFGMLAGRSAKEVAEVTKAVADVCGAKPRTVSKGYAALYPHRYSLLSEGVKAKLERRTGADADIPAQV